MSKSGIQESLIRVQEELHRLESEDKMLTDEYEKFLDLQDRLLKVCPPDKEREKINPNTVLEVGGKVLISAIIMVIERDGVLSTKIPIPSFALFRK